MDKSLTVALSSTLLNLPDHREAVIKACAKLEMQTRIPPVEGSKIQINRAALQLIERADIYISVLAHHKGYVLEDTDISFAELEYNAALLRDIPCLVFMMRDETLLNTGW